MSDVRVGWVGFHHEGAPALEALLERHMVVGAITLTAEEAAKRSGAADVAGICQRAGVPVDMVVNINDEEALATMRTWDADVIFVIGWSQILSEEALSCARVGTIGAHASLLPHLRGSAPVNWAIIRGETESGNSLMWLDTAVDNGDLVDQRAFPITPYDTCATVYERVAETNRDMILDLLAALSRGEHPRTPQGDTREPLLPRRRPADGLIDWDQPAPSVHRFIRALTRPYPGAFTHHGEARYVVWGSAEASGVDVSAPPGQIVGALRSPVAEACGLLVACGEGAIAVLELEADDGSLLTGPALADLDWQGNRLT